MNTSESIEQFYLDLIKNYNDTIQDLEANYEYFQLISGGVMKSMGNVLKSQIEDLKKEKLMYEKEFEIFTQSKNIQLIKDCYKNIH